MALPRANYRDLFFFLFYLYLWTNKLKDKTLPAPRRRDLPERLESKSFYEATVNHIRV